MCSSRNPALMEDSVPQWCHKSYIPTTLSGRDRKQRQLWSVNPSTLQLPGSNHGQVSRTCTRVKYSKWNTLWMSIASIMPCMTKHFQCARGTSYPTTSDFKGPISDCHYVRGSSFCCFDQFLSCIIMIYSTLLIHYSDTCATKHLHIFLTPNFNQTEEWACLSGGFTPCRHLRPSSGRERTII